MECIGLSRTETLAKLKLTEDDLIDKGLGGAGLWQIERTVSVEGLDFTVFLGFDTSKSGEPFTKIIYEYISDSSNDDKNFIVMKKIAKILTEKYDNPFTDEIAGGEWLYSIEDLNSIDDYNVKSTEGYKDIWLLGSRIESGVFKDLRTICTLNFDYTPQKYARTKLIFSIFSRLERN